MLDSETTIEVSQIDAHALVEQVKQDREYLAARRQAQQQAEQAHQQEEVEPDEETDQPAED